MQMHKAMIQHHMDETDILHGPGVVALTVTKGTSLYKNVTSFYIVIFSLTGK